MRKERDRHERDRLPTAMDDLDCWLDGGLAKGTLIEVTGNASSGRFALTLAVMASVTRTGQAAALVDLGDHLDPQQAHAMGVDLARLLWIRPKRLKDALASAEIAMDLSVPLVVLDLGLERVRAVSALQSYWVRLQRAAVARRVALMVSTSHPACGFAADVALVTERVRTQWLPHGMGLLERVAARVLLRKRRGLAGGKAMDLWLAAEDAWRVRQGQGPSPLAADAVRLRITA